MLDGSKGITEPIRLGTTCSTDHGITATAPPLDGITKPMLDDTTGATDGHITAGEDEDEKWLRVNTYTQSIKSISDEVEDEVEANRLILMP
ncbi:hypothetical protein E3N88_33951 [Mikania micrantha]|uniref:Uncharacterized protein n=1 Tax=Mikania micrantha TaxID=192012 RepID=A0A5N6MD03_9ASTR|nr:hypothetical protein E3N88_33951 [Mikania micrantha]